MLTPERWEAVERIFHDALAYAPSERTQFIDSSCGDDAELKSEVESLLAESDGHSRSGIAAAVAADWAAAGQPPAIVGREVDGCHVRSLIGAGGMGEVYLADDLSLDRRIALKLLPSPFTADTGRVRRFTEEARAASALNHPNIITVYRIGEFEGRRYIATEFIDGETIGARIARGPMPPRDALDFAIQAAAALGAAHDAGIVHRDIKPENLMIRRDGYLKVVDFGLAKLTDGEHLIEAAASGDGRRALTRIGAVLGTAGYMAPEQAAATVVDGRADLFSLAVVLHEMLTGRLPAPPNDSSDSGPVLDEHALPPQSIAVLRRALSIDPAARYQTAREMKADLERAHRQIVEREAVPRRRWRQALAAAAVLTIPTAGLWLWGGEPRQSGPPQLTRLAVLPFQIVGFDDDESYLTLGITDAVITRLGTLPQLEVRPTSSVIRYAGARVDSAEVGRKLGVEAVLDGLVQRTGDVVRVTIQLVDAATGAQTWSARIDEPATDLFAIQDVVSKRVAANLATGLSDAARAQILAAQTPDPNAYRAYLQGRFYLSKLTADEVKTAMTLFQRAIQLDRRYAPAHAGLASAYRLLGSNLLRYQIGSFEGPELAREHARKALAIDDRLPEAILVLADVQFQHDWNWTAAEASFKRALAISPNSSAAHSRYGWFLTSRGRFDEALSAYARAISLDPVSYVALERWAVALDFAGRSDEALKVLDEAIALAPDVRRQHWRQSLIYQHLNRFEEAFAARLLSATPSESARLRDVDTGGGYRAVLEYERAKRLAAGEWVSLSVVETALGEFDAALDHLETALEQRDSFLPFLGVNTSFVSLREQPRFKAIVQTIDRSPNPGR